MQKPKDYDQTEIKKGFTPLTPGGHKCVLLSVEETQSRNTGMEMIKVEVDTDMNDSQPGYYKDLQFNATKWLVTDGRSEHGTENLKSFITAVETSNPGYRVIWGAKAAWEAQFRGKKIGCVFGEEEYYNDAKELKTSVKPRYFCTYDEADQQKVPAKKTAEAPKPTLAETYESQAQEGFMQIPDELSDEGLPFN